MKYSQLVIVAIVACAASAAPLGNRGDPSLDVAQTLVRRTNNHLGAPSSSSGGQSSSSSSMLAPPPPKGGQSSRSSMPTSSSSSTNMNDDDLFAAWLKEPHSPSLAPEGVNVAKGRTLPAGTDLTGLPIGPGPMTLVVPQLPPAASSSHSNDNNGKGKGTAH